MPKELVSILVSGASIIITGLLTWGVAVLTNFLNSKIKDKQVASWLTQITKIVTDAVQQVFQSFVETLKEQGKFDEEAQKEAREKALLIIKSQLTPELIAFIKTNFGDLETWLVTQIESIIYNLKARSKTK